ncbi:MAG TPA: hypothetical protein VN048_11725 [Verrucomicrobiae bacterium]|jgi:hypothetical protein|nr:hypothetical protein [Verrucomicrobiae bacterium]
MSKWKPALALLLVFIAGMFVGVVGTRMVVRRIATAMLTDPQLARDMVQRRIVLQLTRRLNLTPEQRAQVREILSEMQGQLKMINQEAQPRRVQAITNAEAQIDLVLTTEQKLEFGRLKEEYPAILLPNQFPQQFRQQQQPPPPPQ